MDELTILMMTKKKQTNRKDQHADSLLTFGHTNKEIVVNKNSNYCINPQKTNSTNLTSL